METLFYFSLDSHEYKVDYMLDEGKDIYSMTRIELRVLPISNCGRITVTGAQWLKPTSRYCFGEQLFHMSRGTR